MFPLGSNRLSRMCRVLLFLNEGISYGFFTLFRCVEYLCICECVCVNRLQTTKQFPFLRFHDVDSLYFILVAVVIASVFTVGGLLRYLSNVESAFFLIHIDGRECPLRLPFTYT